MMRLSTEDNGDGAGDADRAAAAAIPLLALLLLVATASLEVALAVLGPAPPSALITSNKLVSGSANGMGAGWAWAGLVWVSEQWSAVRWSNAAGAVTALRPSHRVQQAAEAHKERQRECCCRRVDGVMSGRRADRQTDREANGARGQPAAAAAVTRPLFLCVRRRCDHARSVCENVHLENRQIAVQSVRVEGGTRRQ